MDNKTIENRLHLFEDVASDDHDTIYEVVSAFSALCRLLSQKEILTSDEFNSIVNKRRYHPPTEIKPVIHAHWETDNYGYAILNEDGDTLYLAGVPCSRCHVTGHTNWNYCPNCGAKMDEEVET